MNKILITLVIPSVKEEFDVLIEGSAAHFHTFVKIFLEKVGEIYKNRVTVHTPTDGNQAVSPSAFTVRPAFIHGAVWARA